MSNILNFLIFFILISGCSLNKNSKFWTSTKNIDEEKSKNEKILLQEKALKKEFNPDLKIKLDIKPIKSSYKNDYLNNNQRINFDGILKKKSRYRFSKIKDFHRYEPSIVFFKNNIIFFDNKGSILQFDKDSKLIWKKNYYKKSEKKLNPILQFSHNDKYLIIIDNISKYYAIDLKTGDLIWLKNNIAPFNSQIKIYKDKFFAIDFSNTLRCFSLKNGQELWNIQTENSLIRSKKRLSMVIVDENIYFNNSVGDISAVDINNGNLLWQLPTQSSLIYESAFTLETSDITTDKKSLFFSNNKNQFYSIDIKTGSFNWKNKINSNLRTSLIGRYLLSVSIEGFLVIVEKSSGNIIRVTDVFGGFKPKKRNSIKPTGFVVGTNNIYLSTSNGKLILIDIYSGRPISTLKIDNEKISRPSILNKNIFVIKDNAIIKLN